MLKIRYTEFIKDTVKDALTFLIAICFKIRFVTKFLTLALFDKNLNIVASQKIDRVQKYFYRTGCNFYRSCQIHVRDGKREE